MEVAESGLCDGGVEERVQEVVRREVLTRGRLTRLLLPAERGLKQAALEAWRVVEAGEGVAWGERVDLVDEVAETG